MPEASLFDWTCGETIGVAFDNDREHHSCICMVTAKMERSRRRRSKENVFASQVYSYARAFMTRAMKPK